MLSDTTKLTVTITSDPRHGTGVVVVSDEGEVLYEANDLEGLDEAIALVQGWDQDTDD